MTSRFESLLTCELGRSGVPYARGVRAGDWVFASGVLASDFVAGMDRRIAHPGLPNAGRPRHFEEARIVLERAREVLRAGGSELARSVRLDQFYPCAEPVAHHQAARKAAFGSYVPPSTSILERSLLLPDAGIGIELLALSGTDAEPIATFHPPELEVPAGAGFAPVVRARDFVFVAGMLAAHQPGDLGGIAPAARVPAGHLWKGVRIQLEAEYIMRHKIAPALAAAGASFDDVVKVQVFLSDLADIPAFNEVWNRWLGSGRAVRTFVPTARPGFAIADATIEINVVAACGAARAVPVPSSTFTPYAHDPVAVRAGELLLISGLMAIDDTGLVRTAIADPRQPWFTSTIEAQMEHILACAQAICAAAGTSLGRVARIQQFHTCLADFLPACRVWQRFIPGVPLPISAIEVPGALPVPGASVQLDLWVHVPGTA